MAGVATNATARADEGVTKNVSGVTIATVGAANYGSFVGVPVERLGVGIEAGGTAVPVNLSALLEAGRTANGLGAHRLQFGGGVSSPVAWFRVSAGVHVAYAILVRATERNAFGNALLGDIGSFGLGVHASFELAPPLGKDLRLVLGGRGMFELYDGGKGWAVGPIAGLRF